jgi:hypothetical protein
MYKNVINSLVNTSVRWMAPCSIVGRLYSRRNPTPLSWNKKIRNRPINVDLLGIIILKFGHKCFDSIYRSFVLCFSSQGTKKKYHVIKLGVSRKRYSDLSNDLLALVRIQNDSMEGLICNK